jgi:acyl-coenzyme A thioesterase PaaI-like protein
MSCSQAELDGLLARIPYARFLGVRMELHGDEMTGVLPYADHLIGNPTLPALHGGVIGAFMEMTAMLQLSAAEVQSRQPRPVDVSIDYLRSGRPVDTYARALIKKVGRRIANVQVEAWQEARGAPIAALHGHFLLTPRQPDVA